MPADVLIPLLTLVAATLAGAVVSAAPVLFAVALSAWLRRRPSRRLFVRGRHCRPSVLIGG